MRIKTFALCTASFAALTIAAPATAQEQQTPVDPNVQAQTNPADPDQGAPQTDDATADGGDTIVVTGLRRSLQSAQNIKRNSDQIVDAIVAEDIGKLPDLTVSDTAARIPGIQVERNGGEASRVLVRGLDRFFYATTYNGREIFTAETRSVALQDFPSGAIAAVEAFKTSTADLVEPGLAGLVNVRSRRPLDFRGLEIAGSAWMLFPDQSKRESLNGNLMVANRWNVGDGHEVGALLGFSYTQLKFRDSVRRHGFFVANLAGGRSPDWPEIQYNQGDRWRPSINGTLQYRAGDLNLYAEGLWQGYRENQTDQFYTQPLWSCGEASYSNIVVRPGTNQIVSGTVISPGCDGMPWGISGAGTRKTNTYQFAIGGSYDAGPLRITADLARTDSKFEDLTESIDTQVFSNNGLRVDWFTGLPGGDGPTFQVSGIDLSNIANWRYRGFYEEYQFAKGDDWQGRIDAEYEFGDDLLRSVQFGVRGVTRDASRRAGAVYWDWYNSNTPLSSTGLQFQLFRPGFGGDDLRPAPTTWFAPSFSSVQASLRNFRQFNINGRGAGGINGGTVDGPNMNPNRAFDITEESLAAYGQLNWGADLGGIEVDGKLGLRAVRTKVDLSGFRTGTGPATPLDFSNSYTDLLPNFNLRAQFSRELVFRLAASKTRTRPEFGDLRPSIDFGAPVVCPPNATNCFRNASGGNPFLEPLESNNYDAALEYYFSRTGFASLSLFRRDMRGFIIQSSYTLPERDENGAQIQVSGPINSGKGKINGVEAQVRTFFDFDFLPSFVRNFGVEANLTYLDAKTDQPTPIGTQRLRIPDTSKWVSNLTGMFEGYGFTSRLSYNWRSGFPEGPIAVDPAFSRQGRARSVSRLDWSNSYAFNDNVTVFADWTNILGEPFRSDIVWTNYVGGAATSQEIFPMVVRFEETILSGGVRFRF